MLLVGRACALALSAAVVGDDPLAPRFVDPDSDGDGLSDFQEVHKYRTDPANADSDGDGVPDGDRDERREFTYTVRTRVRVVPPVDVSAIDDYQDARVTAKGDGWVELEAIHYPFATSGDAIDGDPAWRDGVGAWGRYLESTTTSRWTEKMRKTLLAELEARGVDVEHADDETLAVAAAQHLMERSELQDGFTTFATDFRGGSAVVPQELAAVVRRRERETGRSVEEQWERELFADGMFAHRVHGSCTSSAIYLCGGLRAAGIPTRILLSIPLVDANDPAQIALVERGIRHAGVRAVALDGLGRLEGSWASHTFNEVLVGGRWRRLNYARLGQPILDPGLYGLTTHVLTVRDWADARMGRTVGRRQELRLRDDVFRTMNPYAALEVEDAFGPHANESDFVLAALAPLEEVQLVRALWGASDELPAYLGLSGVDLASDRLHVFVGARLEGKPLERAQVEAFWDAAPKAFRLVGEDGTELSAPAVRGFWHGAIGAEQFLYFVLRTEASERDRMRPGERYAIVAPDAAAAPRFTTADDLAIVAPR